VSGSLGSQVFSTVVQEIAIDPEVLGILIRDLLYRALIEAEDLRFRQREEEGGMRGDDELDIAPEGKLPQHPEEFELIYRGEGSLRFVEQVQPFSRKPVFEKGHVGLAVGLDHQACAAKVVEAAGVGFTPGIE